MKYCPCHFTPFFFGKYASIYSIILTVYVVFHCMTLS